MPCCNIWPRVCPFRTDGRLPQLFRHALSFVIAFAAAVLFATPGNIVGHGNAGSSSIPPLHSMIMAARA